MKIRSDFVTNSSSSSFTLLIRFNLVNGESVSFNAQGGTGETGRIDYFNDDAIVTVSPKQLGNAKSIDELIKLLEDGVHDGYGGAKIFDKSRPRRSDAFCDGGYEYEDEDEDEDEENEIDNCKMFDAYDFVLELREKVKSMDDIETIVISGDEENYVNYNRFYEYNLKTKKYDGVEEGCAFEKDGSSGGDLCFDDLDDCDITFCGRNE